MTRTGVAIVLVLVLLLGGTAVMLLSRYRANALLAECSLNLKRIGDAIFLFDGQKETLREAKLDARGNGRGMLPASRIAPAYATWVVQIAPFLSDKNPVAGWDMERTYFDQPAAARQAALPMFFCPARHRDSLLSRSGDVPTADGKHLAGAVGDYACSSGNAAAWETADANGAIILGEALEEKEGRVLRWRSRTTFAALTRGKSFTLLAGEKHVPWGKFGQAAFGDGSIYNGANPASSARIAGPGHGLAAGPTAPYTVNFGSYHPDACQFLMADDSVRTLRNDVSEAVLGELARRE